jgi:ubiquinone/menaquinone biosynthesis C-methylase UbiE
MTLNNKTFENHILYISTATRFFSTLLIKGKIQSKINIPSKKLAILLSKNIVIAQKVELFKEDNEPFTWHFQLEALIKEMGDLQKISIQIKTESESIELSFDEILNMQTHVQDSLFKKFLSSIAMKKNSSLLDIGGRARSGLLRADGFSNTNVTVLDIHQDVGVDVVGDAHLLSKLFERNSFDFCMSVSVFEHILMPWKVAIEANKVMKTGGLFYIATHQSVGMHDLPWDYYRYSSDSWNGIFNSKTGFKIVDRSMSGLNHIVPFIRKDYINSNTEKSAGFESSDVLVEKISDTSLQWDVDINEVIENKYPR